MLSQTFENKKRENPFYLFYRTLHWLRPYWKFQFLALLSAFFIAVLALVPPWMNKILIDDVLVKKDSYALKVVCLLFLLSIILTSIFTIIRTWFYTNAAERAVVDIRDDLCEAFHSLSYEQIAMQSTGSIMSLSTNDVPVMQDLYASTLSDCIIDILRILVSLSFMFVINWQLSLIVLPSLLLFIITLKVFSKPLRDISFDVQNQASSVSHELNESLSGAREIKVWGQKLFECQRLHKIFMPFLPLRLRQSVLMSASSGISDCIVISTLVLILLIGGIKAIEGHIQIGVLIAFTCYVGEIFGPVGRTFQLNNRVQKVLAASNRIFAFLDLTKTNSFEKKKFDSESSQEMATGFRPRIEAKSSENLDGKDREIKRLEQDLAPIKGVLHQERINQSLRPIPSSEGGEDSCSLTLRDVCYKFKGKQVEILKGISFDVQAGEIVAIVGPSGSGKTTLAYLLAGLYSPTSGAITFDLSNQGSSNVADYLSKHSAVVFRDSFIFSQSVKNNILYGRPEASDEDVLDAAKAAHAHVFISELPKKYESEVGQWGCSLSSGQGQRLVISRVFLKKPKLLLLDEGTSALDHQIEKKVEKAIRILMKTGIVIIISHRLSSIIDADKIIVLNHGTIESIGTHLDLMKNSKTYQEIFAELKKLT